MRSITSKLVLAFVGLSFLSVALIVLVISWTTSREFSRYLLDQNQARLVAALSKYYVEHQGWTGLNLDHLTFEGGKSINLDTRRRQSFALADIDGKIILGRGDFNTGGFLSSTTPLSGIPIQVNGKRVGSLYLRSLVIQQDVRDVAFLRRMNRLLILIGGGTVLFGFLLAVWLSRTLTRPIRELTAATKAIAKGKLGTFVPVRSRDELGDLAQSFNTMNAELERSLQVRRQMTADIAHELRTPLSLILGHTEAVHDGVLPPSVRSFEIIHEEALRLERLIEDLRVISLADAGELPLDFQPTCIDRWLNDLSASYDHLLQEKKICLQVEVAPEIPDVNMDCARMSQVLANILDNALRYSPIGGIIRLDAGLSQGQLLLRIQDCGPGVDQGDLERIFERFYRIDPSRQRADGGTGLGLAIAKSVVEKHNGSIYAQSQPGEGLTIEIRLPITQRG